MRIKSLVTLVIMLASVLILTGCGGDNSDSKNERKTGSTVSTSSSSASAESKDADKNGSSGDFPYTVKINGEEYSFPMTYDEFLGYGWSMNDPELADTMKMPPERNGTPGNDDSSLFSNGDIKNVEIHFYNPDKTDEAVLKDCLVSGINFDPYSSNGTEIPEGCVVLNSDITIGKSTYEEALAAYGEPVMDGGGVVIYGEDHFNQGLYLTFGSGDILVGVNYLKIW